MRHGEVEAPYQGTFTGRTDVGLSDVGRHQAEAIKEYLKDAAVDAVVTSPLRRARETVAPLVQQVGIQPKVLPELAEMDFGAWEGKTWQQIVDADRAAAEAWEMDPATVPCPGGESCDTFYARVEPAIQRLVDEYRGRSVVLAGHAGVNRCVLAHVLRRPYLECMAFAQDYGCLNAVGWSAEGFGQVVLVNLVVGPRSASTD